MNREVATWRDGPQEAAGSKGERFWYTTNNQVQEAWYKADNVWTATPSNWATFRGYAYTPDMLNWSSVNDNGYSVPFVANALNQYTGVNGSIPGYDDRFNLRLFGGFTYEHDSANQLTSVTGNGHSASFTYDGLGRCVRRTVDGTTRLFTYDAWNPIIEFDQAGSWKAMNLYGFGADEILGRYDAALGSLIYKQDKQGNVTFVLNGSNQIIEKYTYDAFGTPTILSASNTQLSASAIGNRFMYTGREWIGELGIYDYRHRYYLPSIGRFIQTDPTGFDAGDMNLYRYCDDDPVDRSDPMGLWSVWSNEMWMQSGSTLSSNQFDLLRQGKAFLADPTGNYKDSNIEKHVDESKIPRDAAATTHYSVSNVEETNGILIIRPTLDWYVRDKFKNTDVVKRELEHVSRFLWWQSKEGDGAAMVRSFNRNPSGANELKKKAENARLEEKIWHDQNLHAKGRHDLSKNPAKDMKPADIERLIRNVGPVEEPQLGN